MLDSQFWYLLFIQDLTKTTGKRRIHITAVPTACMLHLVSPNILTLGLSQPIKPPKQQTCWCYDVHGKPDPAQEFSINVVKVESLKTQTTHKFYLHIHGWQMKVKPALSAICIQLFSFFPFHVSPPVHTVYTNSDKCWIQSSGGHLSLRAPLVTLRACVIWKRNISSKRIITFIKPNSFSNSNIKQYVNNVQMQQGWRYFRFHNNASLTFTHKIQ